LQCTLSESPTISFDAGESDAQDFCRGAVKHRDPSVRQEACDLLLLSTLIFMIP
jgi:hypothetical protein